MTITIKTLLLKFYKPLLYMLPFSPFSLVFCVCVPALVFHYVFAEVREQIREVVFLPSPVGSRDVPQNFRIGGRKEPLLL